MKKRIGINGFGRIGRLTLRAGWDFPEIEFDSVHGRWRRGIRRETDKVVIAGKTLGHTSEKDFSNVRLGDLGVDIVLEASGRFRTPEQLDAYFKADVKKVIVEAPSTMVTNGTELKIPAWYDNE